MKYIVTVNGEGHEVDLDGGTARTDGQTFETRVAEIEGTPVRVVTLGDEVHRVMVRRGEGRGRYTFWLEGHRFEVEALDERTHTIRALSGAAAGPAGPAPLIAPMPGLIVRVNVQAGDEVAAGQGLVVMEAMKMENELRAAAAGVVTAMNATPGAAVEKGAVLVELGALPE
jgi:acetyl/propionyl-CoA carboxylase alpha subunit